MTTLILNARLVYNELLLQHMQERDGATHPDLPDVVIRIRELKDRLGYC